MLIVGDVYVLINYVMFTDSAFLLATVSGLLWLRWKRPDAVRPIKVINYFFGSKLFNLFIYNFILKKMFFLGESCLPDSFHGGVRLSGLPAHHFKSGWRHNGYRNYRNCHTNLLLLYSVQAQTQVDLI